MDGADNGQYGRGVVDKGGMGEEKGVRDPYMDREWMGDMTYLFRLGRGGRFRNGRTIPFTSYDNGKLPVSS